MGMDWLTEHHATIDCRSYQVIFGDIHAPEYTYHGSLPGKSMQIISALQARTLLSHGCEDFLATIHDMTPEIPSIHDQPIVSEFPDVFPDELPGIPPVREVEFNIKLIPGAKPSPRLLTTVIHIELSLVTFMHLILFIMVPYWENLCRSFPLCKYVPYCLMAMKPARSLATQIELSGALTCKIK
nr:putative reverse transcriptase domain, aspartic peptidase domain protein [Tanacetum cinerariifolium]